MLDIRALLAIFVALAAIGALVFARWRARKRNESVLKAKMEEKVTATVQPDGVFVPTEVAAELLGHLRAQGRNGIFASHVEAHERLSAFVERMWGTSGCKRFTDAVGGGWILDISDAVEGEALHALIRTTHGRRTVMTVVDEDELEHFTSERTWKSPRAMSVTPPGVDDSVVAQAAAIESKGQKPSVSPAAVAVQREPQVAAPNPKDPVLVLVISIVKEGHEPQILQSMRSAREDVPGIVKMLLRTGFDGKPVSEDQIEVWSAVSRPKLEVKF